ncbi:MAG: isoleucine--tRNA ligase [Candidatus Omnitrophota bacterium]|nr:isoleucine--tRNA ligase [Candidatus Omnitrophota bacterium]
MDYKNTLNLPKTDFAMKADLPKREPELLKDWEGMNIYRLISEKPGAKEKYILHDGPPYANGDIHIGHALNKTLKDIIVKYKTMLGFNCAYVPGWDCHGLPVEHQLFRELGINKSQIGQLQFRKKAYDYALKYISVQKEEFKRLGVFGDWDHPYLTLAPDYEESILNSLAKLCEEGYIYRGLKPVNWCSKCETALAEAEVEYQEHTSPSVYVKFKLDKNEVFKKDIYLVIWTTTPWTLIANVAVAVHPEFFYSHYITEQGDLIIAECREQELSLLGIKNIKKIGTFKGKDLEGMTYEHPFGLREGKIVLAEYVSKDEGTGLVHTAPGHGNEDYFTALKYKLDIVMPVDSKGNFDATAQEFKGLNVFKANKLIIEKLQKSNLLLYSGSINHPYPHCWRCKEPLIFRATRQWFLKIDHRDLRKRLIESINGDIKWVPASGRERITAMVELRPDWCLSRQRYWGVPIPALACAACKEEFLEPQLIRKFASISAKEGTDSWFKRDLKDFLTPGLKCPHCKNDNFSKGNDILDVWFDSGVSSQAVLKRRSELEFPCALYLEGSDQHRGWFQSSLIAAMCIDDQPPFKQVLTHGFVVDGEGRKMSKSMGNVISPFDIIKHSGADILRIWVAASDYNEDIRISKEILTRLSEAYRKIRNTVRFILSNLYDFDPGKDKLEYEKLKKVDKYFLKRLQWHIGYIGDAYENFEFHNAFKDIYDLCNLELSMYYLDMIKGRLYTYAADSVERRAAQTVIYEFLDVLVRVIAPILVFSAEEAWRCMPKQKEKNSLVSVHLLDWPKINPVFAQQDLEPSKQDIETELKPVIKLIADVAKALEEKRTQGLIGSSFDARINLLTNNQERYKFLRSLEGDLCEVFKVSQVQIIKDDNLSAEVKFEVSKAEGEKCQRCWNFSHSVGRNKDHPALCQRCLKAIGGKE